ncbi:MAG: hypothetical protein HND52_07575 [Ignavibacteriae bacterium]|nr:hypothetical protein [Ignavibacteriota bacterium]NOG97805.1 hypothetical protein [Ignavibacteriota bacterium]
MNLSFSKSPLIVFLIFLIISACAGIGENFSIIPHEDLFIGLTTVEDVKNKFGEPQEINIIERDGLESNLLYYYYARRVNYYAESRSKELQLEFIKGILNGYAYQNSIDRNSTDFAEKNRMKIENGITSANDIESLFGKPHGIITLPSNLISIDPEISDEIKKDEIVYCWIYIYYYYEGANHRLKEYEKNLIIYFDKNNTVVAKYFSSNISN